VILSKAEQEYLRDPESVSANYAKVLRHRIKRKREALREELELLQNAELVTIQNNAVTQECNQNQVAFGSWSWGWELNPHIAALQAAA
jgi:ribonuclease P protein component